MATEQALKKKLRVIRSTGKLTRAMKTISTVKYSKLNSLYGIYEKYAVGCNELYETYRSELNSTFSVKNPAAPVCYVLISGNKGMCGGFNTELFNFFHAELEKENKGFVLVGCGKKAEVFLASRDYFAEEIFIFDDVPSYEKSKELFMLLKGLLAEGKISGVKTVYQSYVNMMLQKPVCLDLFCFEKEKEPEESPLFVPDRETFIKNSADGVLTSILHKRILESALGAQAATLITMRSAYDTACEYSAQLELEINRKRQSRVTADVLEISSKGDEL